MMYEIEDIIQQIWKEKKLQLEPWGVLAFSGVQS